MHKIEIHSSKHGTFGSKAFLQKITLNKMSDLFILLLLIINRGDYVF